MGVKTNNTTSKQTAVEWLKNQLKDVKYNPLEKNGYSNALDKLYDQAKEMERQQIVNAVDGFPLDKRHLHGEQYYKETYGC
jgi:hypothetical protein